MSTKLTKFYPNISPVTRPNISVPTKLDPNWISGFTAGEGGFSLNLFQPNTSKERVGYQFRITQHTRDIKLITQLKEFFGCGRVVKRSNINTPRCDYVVQDIKNIATKIITHFERYPLQNIKHLDYLDFKQAINIITNARNI